MGFRTGALAFVSMIGVQLDKWKNQPQAVRLLIFQAIPAFLQEIAYMHRDERGEQELYC